MVAYSDLNQPQTITAPSSSKPFTQFTARIQGLLQGLGSLTGGGTSQSGGSTPSSGKLQRYSQCIQKAGSDVSKMQRCASILNK